MQSRLSRGHAFALLAVALITQAAAQTTAPAEKVDLKFSFGPSPIPGYVQVQPDATYSAESGYGFDLGSKVSVAENGGYVTGANGKPFFFSAKLAPGAYQVTVTLGDTSGASTTTVKSETRRLMLEAKQTASGQLQKHTFLVHIRVPQIPDGRIVRMKPRENELNRLFISWEKEMEVTFLELDWDEKLTLEFSDAKPALSAIEITNVDKPVTIYLIGDSTMTDQMMEPWGAWGQQFPRFFKPPVLIANYAQSGETTASFIGELRWAKLLSEIKAGDYVLMQFGINDRSLPLDRFKQYFIQYVDETRAKGATPVLVTSQNLRRLSPEGKGMNTLSGYPQAMRDAAREKDAILIDLNEMSAKLYEALGPQDLPKAFVDGTHQNMYGAYVLAKCVVQGAIDAKLPWAQHVVEDWKPFDPSKPDAVASFKLPPDPQLDPARPGGPGLPGTGRGPMAGDVGGGGRRGGRGAATQPATQPYQP